MGNRVIGIQIAPSIVSFDGVENKEFAVPIEIGQGKVTAITIRGEAGRREFIEEFDFGGVTTADIEHADQVSRLP